MNRLVSMLLSLGVAGCASPSGGGDAMPCEAVGLTLENGAPAMHYWQEWGPDGRLQVEERRYDGADAVGRSEFLYAAGELVHQRDDVDGDGRLELVVDWLRDPSGRVLAVEEYDRVGDRHYRTEQTWEGDEVVRRVHTVDGTLLSDEQVVLDADGRPLQQWVYDSAGEVQSRWVATYVAPPPSLDRHREGWLGGVLETDAFEAFDDAGRMVLQEGLAEGYPRTWSRAYEGDRPVQETLAFGSLEQTHTWAYDEAERLVEERVELVGDGVVIEEIVTTWEHACPTR